MIPTEKHIKLSYWQLCAGIPCWLLRVAAEHHPLEINLRGTVIYYHKGRLNIERILMGRPDANDLKAVIVGDDDGLMVV